MFRILIVEDNYAHGELAKVMLEREGYEIDVVDSAVEAEIYLEERKYDIAVVDLMLDNERGETDIDGGIKLCELIRQIKPMLPIILATARIDEEAKKRCEKIVNIKNTINKPFERIQIVACVNEILKGEAGEEDDD